MAKDKKETEEELNLYFLGFGRGAPIWADKISHSLLIQASDFHEALRKGTSYMDKKYHGRFSYNNYSALIGQKKKSLDEEIIETENIE